jgi:hypothetical protein
MNTSSDLRFSKKDRKHLPLNSLARFKKIMMTGLRITLMLTCLQTNAQRKICPDCCLSSFGEVTVYHTIQPGSGYGFGLEAGKWNKEESRFSYFMGMKMQWFNPPSTLSKSASNPDNIMRFAVYVKGQFEMLNKLYIVATPQFVNLSSFEAGLGIRWVYPLSNSIGIGLEPTYSVVQKQCSLNTNIHFALK